MPAVNKGNHRTIDCHELARVVKFSPFELSSDLLAIGTASKIVVYSCLEPEEKSNLVDVIFEKVVDFHYGTSVIDISWSPQTNLHSIPRSIKLFAVGSDKKVQYLSSDLKGSTNLTVLGEHRDYVNAVASHPETGESVVSVSDDHTCCVWPVDSDSADDALSFPLTSPGMAVCWHPQEPSKIMVAEKKGVIRFYSIVTRRAFMSLDCSQVPLLSADWCLANSLRLAALAGSDWFMFDTSHSSLPVETRMAHSGGGQMIRWSLSHDHLFATTGRPGSMLKVFSLKTNQSTSLSPIQLMLLEVAQWPITLLQQSGFQSQVILSIEKKIISGLSWHARQPIVAIGSDDGVHLFLIVDVL